MRRLLLAVVTAGLCVAMAKPVSAQGQPESDLDIRRLMTASDFKTAGLEKLSLEELRALNQWLNRFTARVLQVSQIAPGGCAGTIETKIDDEFEGWDGDTIFKLANGQIWQQSSYAYTYHYAYRPDVTIFPSGGRCKMKVDGVSSTISVKRLR